MYTSGLDKVVTFLIGPKNDTQKFIVHKSFIDRHCPPLRAAFNSTFIEGESKTYKLEDVTAPTFRLFVKWSVRLLPLFVPVLVCFRRGEQELLQG
jgi:hypothetical protein